MTDYYLGGRGFRKKRVKSLEEAANIMVARDTLYLVEPTIELTGICKFPEKIRIIGDNNNIILDSGRIELETGTILKNVSISYSPYDGGVFLQKNSRSWLENIQIKAYGNFKSENAPIPALEAIQVKEVRLINCSVDYAELNAEEISIKSTTLGTTGQCLTKIYSEKLNIETGNFANVEFSGIGQAEKFSVFGEVFFSKNSKYQIDKLLSEEPDSLKSVRSSKNNVLTLITNHGKLKIKDISVTHRKYSPILWKNGLRLFINKGQLELQGQQLRLFNKKSRQESGTLFLNHYSDKTPWFYISGKVSMRESDVKGLDSKSEKILEVKKKEKQESTTKELASSKIEKKSVPPKIIFEEVEEQKILDNRQLAIIASEILDKEYYILDSRAQDVLLEFINRSHEVGLTTNNEAWVSDVIRFIKGTQKSRIAMDSITNKGLNVSLITGKDVEKGLMAYADEMEKLRG